MFVQFNRTLRKSPFDELRESDAQYRAKVVVTDTELTDSKNGTETNKLRVPDFPLEPLGPLPLGALFLEHVKCRSRVRLTRT